MRLLLSSMLSKTFLSFSLIGAEWVLYVLVLLSILSFTFIFERWFFYKNAVKNQSEFDSQIRALIEKDNLAQAKELADQKIKNNPEDFSANVAHQLITAKNKTRALHEIGDDAILKTKKHWDKNLAYLATIGSNAPFIGLFGTVLGIIQAFNNLSQKAAEGVQGVTAGLADALIATAMGIFVAIPAVVAFNLFQKKVKSSTTSAEALKNFLIAHLKKD